MGRILDVMELKCDIQLRMERQLDIHLRTQEGQVKLL